MDVQNISSIGTDEEALSEFISRYDKERPALIQRLGGYSNRNYVITRNNGTKYTARIARINRSGESVAAEEHILQALLRQEAVRVPGLAFPFPLHSRLTCQDGTHYLHFFHHLKGKISCLWWQQCSPQQLQQIFRHLAILHQAMEEIPALASSEAQLFHYPLPANAPEHLSATGTGKYVIDQWPAFKAAAAKLQQDIAAAFPWEKARLQWIHGDIQLENILFDNNHLTAILDFELASWDAVEKDVILSAFRTCKEGNTDKPFHYDAGLLALALDTYLAHHPRVCTGFFHSYNELWKPFFCLDQTMVYLRNAFDGIWQLDEGIGFLPCFNEVLLYR